MTTATLAAQAETYSPEIQAMINRSSTRGQIVEGLLQQLLALSKIEQPTSAQIESIKTLTAAIKDLDTCNFHYQ